MRLIKNIWSKHHLPTSPYVVCEKCGFNLGVYSTCKQCYKLEPCLDHKSVCIHLLCSSDWLEWYVHWIGWNGIFTDWLEWCVMLPDWSEYFHLKTCPSYRLECVCYFL